MTLSLAHLGCHEQSKTRRDDQHHLLDAQGHGCMKRSHYHKLPVYSLHRRQAQAQAVAHGSIVLKWAPRNGDKRSVWFCPVRLVILVDVVHLVAIGLKCSQMGLIVTQTYSYK
jgi:hypothetical protein